MESQPQTVEINFSNDSCTDNYMEDLIELSFSYYDYHKNKDLFESSLETLITNYKENLKALEIKTHLKFLIDFIGKYTNADRKFLESSLENLKMRSNHIDLFYNYLITYNDQVNVLKQAILEKISTHRIINFSHSFNVKLCDSSTDKVSFAIKIIMSYYDDNEEVKKIELDLTINQFYAIFTELQKIDTMIKTLI
ncbi:MAG: hypothetical protein MJ252_09905 [archaeon]|nr:hypothetical protein [archaeon]